MMRHVAWTLLLTAAALQGQQSEESEPALLRFPIAAGGGPVKLLVDNLVGDIRVRVGTAMEVRARVQRRTRADSPEAMQAARQEVTLDASPRGNFVRLYVDGPFRQPGGSRDRGWRYHGYEVRYDFDVEVPPQTELVLSTVNRSEIQVAGVRGPFEVRNVNGGIAMRDVAGQGTVQTVNGPVEVRFARNPTGACRFKTVNGRVNVYFQPGLSADLRVKTMNGEVWADFPTETLPVPPGTVERRDGRFVYRSADGAALRTGGGGAELRFETLNGRIEMLTSGR